MCACGLGYVDKGMMTCGLINKTIQICLVTA